MHASPWLGYVLRALLLHPGIAVSIAVSGIAVVVVAADVVVGDFAPFLGALGILVAIVLLLHHISPAAHVVIPRGRLRHDGGE
jgi:hypothetical protein